MTDPVVDELLGPSKKIGEPPPVDPVIEGLLGGGLAGSARTAQSPAGGDPIARGDFSITDLITGGERVTPRVEAAKEITGIGAKPTEDFFADLRIKAGMLIAADPGQQIDIIQSAIPEAKVDVENGVVFIGIGDKEFVLNRPGASLQDLTQTIANIVAFFPSARFATKGIEAGGGILASQTAKAQAARGFAAGAGTSAALDVGAQALGAEEGIDVGRAGLTGVLEAAVPLAAGGIRAFRGRGVPIDVEPATVARITEAEAADVPIDLFPAQKTGVLSQLETQSFVASLPGGSQIAFRALEKQNKQAFDATLEFVNRIAPPTAAEGGAQRFRTAAQKAIDQVKIIRKQKASPVYDAAFEDARVFSQTVDTSQVIANLDEVAGKFPTKGEVRRALNKARGHITDAGDDLEKLHNSKTEIDQIISSRKDGGLGPTTQKLLLDVQDGLITKMDDASPRYAEARAEFSRLSPEVDNLKNGIIGRAANVKDPDLKGLSAKIFDAAETDPSVIPRVRKIIDAVDPGAYDDLLRIEMGRRLGKIKPTQSLVENAPGQLRRALFGNQAQRKAMFAALRPPQRAIAKWLDTKLGRASLGRPGGSQTAARQEISGGLKTGTVRALITFLSSPGKTLAKIGEEKAITRNARAVAELIFDPSHEKSIRSIIRQSEQNTREGGQELLTLLAAIAGQELGDEE